MSDKIDPGAKLRLSCIEAEEDFIEVYPTPGSKDRHLTVKIYEDKSESNYVVFLDREKVAALALTLMKWAAR